MISPIMMPTGSDVNLCLKPGRYYFAASNSYTNTPSGLAGLSFFMDVSYVTNTCQYIERSITANSSNQPVIYKQYVSSNSAAPWPSGTFTFQSWYKFTGTAVS